MSKVFSDPAVFGRVRVRSTQNCLGEAGPEMSNILCEFQVRAKVNLLTIKSMLAYKKIRPQI